MIKYVALSAAAGFFLPLQALINARLGGYLTGPLSAALASFATGLIALAVAFAATNGSSPSATQIGAVPWWGWTGGLIGAFFIACAPIAVTRLGTAGVFGAVIAAQLSASLLLDHYGILHPAQPLTLSRLAGAGFLFVGVYLILRPQP